MSLAAVARNHAAAAAAASAAIAASAAAVVLLFIASTSRTKRCVLHTNGLTRLKIRSLSYEIVKTCVYTVKGSFLTHTFESSSIYQINTLFFTFYSSKNHQKNCFQYLIIINIY